MSNPGVRASDGLAWLPVHRFFHERSPRTRVVLSQMPLTVTMVVVLGIVLVFHAELLLDPVVLFILALAIPWHRLPAAATLAVPVLDFLPIGLVRESGVETIPALGAVAVLPWSG